MSAARETPASQDASADGCPAMRVRLVVDGQEISLKPFLHEMIGGAALGLVSGLRGVEEPSSIQLEVERR